MFNRRGNRELYVPETFTNSSSSKFSQDNLILLEDESGSSIRGLNFPLQTPPLRKSSNFEPLAPARIKEETPSLMNTLKLISEQLTLVMGNVKNQPTQSSSLSLNNEETASIKYKRSSFAAEEGTPKFKAFLRERRTPL